MTAISSYQPCLAMEILINFCMPWYHDVQSFQKCDEACCQLQGLDMLVSAHLYEAP